MLIGPTNLESAWQKLKAASDAASSECAHPKDAEEFFIHLSLTTTCVDVIIQFYMSCKINTAVGTPVEEM